VQDDAIGYHTGGGNNGQKKHVGLPEGASDRALGDRIFTCRVIVVAVVLVAVHGALAAGMRAPAETLKCVRMPAHSV
jgi:hypothetical protein